MNLHGLIPRPTDIEEVRSRLSAFPVTALLGPRQSGKTTLARQLSAAAYFDLENPRDARALENPQLALERLQGLIVIDEIQRRPDLFPLLRYLVDTQVAQRYLILGSASRDLIRQSSESLAGRIAHFTLLGLRATDLPPEQTERLWLRGGLPPSLLAPDDTASHGWREEYVRTFLERDIPALGIRVPAPTLRRFWQMLSHYHGGVVNLSELARSLGATDVTVRRYLDILAGTFMVRLLQPWNVNVGKRLVKRPKLYFRDSGLLHALLEIPRFELLLSHPRLGASWEGFALENAWRSIGKADESAYFWATHAGAEIDLFWQHAGRNWACEFKFSDAPAMTRSLHAALTDLDVERIWIVYPGARRYAVHERVEVLPFSAVGPRWDYG